MSIRNQFKPVCWKGGKVEHRNAGLQRIEFLIVTIFIHPNLLNWSPTSKFNPIYMPHTTEYFGDKWPQFTANVVNQSREKSAQEKVYTERQCKACVPLLFLPPGGWIVLPPCGQNSRKVLNLTRKWDLNDGMQNHLLEPPSPQRGKENVSLTLLHDPIEPTWPQLPHSSCSEGWTNRKNRGFRC